MNDADDADDADDSNSWRFDIADLADAFRDVEPLPVGDDDGVAAIDYTLEFRTAFGYLRAMLQRDERSNRALKLTASCLQLNPGNYTVWQYRRRCLGDAIQNDASVIAKDLALTASLGGPNPKNYQIWHHRRALLEHQITESSTVVREELSYLSSVLSHDAKNYHAWSHRMWVVGKTGDGGALWDAELAFVERMIREDARNNSAWNYRWFLLHHQYRQQNGGTAAIHVITPARAIQEADYVVASIGTDAYNESSWRYLVAMVKEQVSALLDRAVALRFVEMVLERVNELGQGLGSANPHYMGAMVDILELKGDRVSLSDAKGLCQDLSEKHDAVRAAFWTMRQNDILRKMERNGNLNEEKI